MLMMAILLMMALLSLIGDKDDSAFTEANVHDVTE